VAWLLIGVFGGLGAMLRYGVSLGAGAAFGAALPWGTLAANVIGSFALGIVVELGESRTIAGVDARLPLGVGLLGGFTTYSSFNLEMLTLYETNGPLRSGAYAITTFAICLAAGMAGLALARALRG
jgi:CrcB protein